MRPALLFRQFFDAEYLIFSYFAKLLLMVAASSNPMLIYLQSGQFAIVAISLLYSNGRA